MLQQSFLNTVASLVGTQQLWGLLKLGTVGDKPTQADGGLKGDVVAQAGTQVTVTANVIKVVALNLPIESGTVKEIGLFNSGNQLQDRLVTPDLAPEAGVRCDVTYILEVVGEGVSNG